MASRLALRHRYPVPPQRLLEVLTDQRYLQDKLRAVGGPRAELVSRQQNERNIAVVLLQSVPGDALPSFLRSVRPGGLMIRRTEIWTGPDGRVRAVVDGAPGTVTGAMRLDPDPTGCVLGARLTAEVSLPFIGGRVEKIITDSVGRLMQAEYRFTLEWLRHSETR